MQNKKKQTKKLRLWSVIFWLSVWQILSMWIGQEILIVSPVAAGRRLFNLITTVPFWNAVLFSTERIMGGFLLGTVGGTGMAVLAYRYRKIEELCYPMICIMKATPVASVIILILMWISSENLSVCIVCLMTLPILYTNILEGLRQMDQGLQEMAEVFDLPIWVRIRWICIPQMLPFMRSGCALGIGLGWKAGTAAEVIGIASGSIGANLYQAKIYLETADLLAWTLMIIVLSYVFEKIFIRMLDLSVERIKKIKVRKTWRKRSQSESWRQKAGQIVQKDITLTHLNKSYGKHCVIKDLSMIFPHQQLTCIMAPSGAGKTTLLRILMGLEQADSGKIEGLDGYRKSAVFQKQIFCESLSVYANIRMVRKRKFFEPEFEEYTIVRKELEAVGLMDCIDQKISELSFGMRQRVAIVRALYADWDILFLDEPFRGLDKEAKRKTAAYIRGKSAEKMVVLVTHEEEEKQLVIET